MIELATADNLDDNEFTLDSKVVEKLTSSQEMASMSSLLTPDWAIYLPTASYLIEMLSSVSVNDLRLLAADADAKRKASEDKPYAVYDGVAHIAVEGMLTKRASCMSTMMGGGATYIGIREALRAADRDPAVLSKLLVIDSPGGETFGMFDAADQVFSGKPTDVYAEDMCASAAQCIAAGGREISCNSSCMMGSVGVYTTLVDKSVMNERMGMSVHVIKAGRYKGIGAGGPVTEEQLASVQSRVDSLHSMFVRQMAKGRTNMSRQQLAEVADAGVFLGKDAIKKGLADRVGSLDQAHRSAIKANSEGVTKSMSVTDQQLKAWLAAEPLAGDTPPVQQAPPAAADMSAAQNPLLNELGRLGFSSVADLRGLASDALTGREVLSSTRAHVNALATAAHTGDMADLDAVKNMLAVAPLAALRAQQRMFEDSLRIRGLAAPVDQASIRTSAPPVPTYQAPLEGTHAANATDTGIVNPKTRVIAGIDAINAKRTQSSESAMAIASGRKN